MQFYNYPVREDTLITSLIQIRTDMVQVVEKNRRLIDQVHPHYRLSAENFIHYLYLRTHNLRDLQELLSSKGISSIGHSERYTLANLDNILKYLHLEKGLDYTPDESVSSKPLDYFAARELLKSNTRRLLGPPAPQVQTRIMVTLPTEAAENYSLVLDLIKAGMQVARINCSHDSRGVWESMIDNIKRARNELHGQCLIYMDLAGPKIRTGEVEEEIVKQSKKKKKKNKKKRKLQDFITLRQGDPLRLYADPVNAQSAQYNKKGELQTPAAVSITLPSVFAHIRPGQRVMFDDGKIAGKVEEVHDDYILISITRTDTKGGKLRGEKGINLPDTPLELPSLTEDDQKNLPFIAGNADIIGYSFVRDPGDILELQAALEDLGRSEIGLVLKIETREAFENFPSIILTAMRSPSIGVMIARGDLAVELGAERISEVQEELLWLSDAAHVPNIWATQVLEKLAKEGIATRAEITDASMSARAECVMMNKGPFIVDAVKTLGNILERMEAHQYKKEGALRALHVAEHFIASL